MLTGNQEVVVEETSEDSEEKEDAEEEKEEEEEEDDEDEDDEDEDEPVDVYPALRDGKYQARWRTKYTPRLGLRLEHEAWIQGKNDSIGSIGLCGHSDWTPFGKIRANMKLQRLLRASAILSSIILTSALRESLLPRSRMVTKISITRKVSTEGGAIPGFQNQDIFC